MDKVTKYEWGKEVAPGITAIDAAGHTPGHTAFAVASGNARVLVQSDVTNIPELFLRNPDWHVAFDIDPQKAVETRRKFYDMAAAEKALVVGFHFTFPSVGYVEKDGTRLSPGADRVESGDLNARRLNPWENAMTELTRRASAHRCRRCGRRRAARHQSAGASRRAAGRRPGAGLVSLQGRQLRDHGGHRRHGPVQGAGQLRRQRQQGRIGQGARRRLSPTGLDGHALQSDRREHRQQARGDRHRHRRGRLHARARARPGSS